MEHYRIILSGSNRAGRFGLSYTSSIPSRFIFANGSGDLRFTDLVISILMNPILCSLAVD